MNPVRMIRLLDVPPQRWRNDGGWTRELLAFPSAAGWRLRISVAEIEADGPFSSFPGVRRFIAVLEGAGVELTIDGTSQSLRRDDAPLQFDGALPVHCRLLDGPTRDLNLMVRGTSGAMERVVKQADWTPAARAGGVFALEAGTCRSREAAVDVPAMALLWFERAPASLRFDASGWWVAA